MWNTEERIKNRKTVAVTNTGYYIPEHEDRKTKETKKLSSVMAMLLGFIVTLEIMVAGGMILNIDFYSADRIALLFSFVVLYFGVVAFLTDK